MDHQPLHRVVVKVRGGKRGGQTDQRDLSALRSRKLSRSLRPLAISRQRSENLQLQAHTQRNMVRSLSTSHQPEFATPFPNRRTQRQTGRKKTGLK